MKARVKETGEIGEVLCWDDVQKTKLRVLLKGSVCTIPYQNIEVIQLGSSDVDWEQRRYEIAKECVAALMTNEITLEDAAKISVEQADILIEKLKGE